MEDNIEFKSILRHLGQDVSYVGLRLKKEVHKCVSDLDTSHDARKYCQKLAEILARFSEYTAQYAKNLQEKIRDAGKEEEYEEAIKTLQRVNSCNCNSCIAKNSNEEKSSSGLQNETCVGSSVADANAAKSELELSLSQCSSVHIGDDVKNEEPTQASTSIEALQNETAHSPSGSSGTIINEEDHNSLLDDTVGNSLEISHSEEIETVVDERSDADDIFDKETLANSPPIMEDLEHMDTALEQQKNVADDEDIVPSKDSQETELAASPSGLSDFATKSVSTEKHSSIDESDDSDIEIVADNLSTPSKENDVCASARSPVCETDATVPNLTPPPDADSDQTVVNQPLSDKESDCSQVFEGAKQPEPIEHEDFDAPTQPVSNVAASADVNKENNDDFDVDFDAPTQVIVNRPGALDSVVRSSLDNVTPDSVARGSEKADLTGITEAVVESEEQKDGAEQENEKLQFFKSLQVVPRSTCSKSKIEISSGEFPAAQEADLQENRPSKDVSEEKSASAGGATSSGCSDIFGDISESESSVNGSATTKIKKKLKEKDRKSLLKLISEYYVNRKKQRLSLEVDNASDSSGTESKQPAKLSPRKRREAKKKKSMEQASTSASKKDKEKQKSVKSQAKRSLNFLPDETTQDDMEIQEDHSDSTEVTETVIDDCHSDETTTQFKDDTVTIDNTDSDKQNTSANEKDPAENDPDLTQKADIRELKGSGAENDCAQNSDGSTAAESQVVGPFKRKKVLPLPSSQSVDGAGSTDSDVWPIKKRTVMPLPNTQLEEGDETDGSQVVQPFRKAVVLPLPPTQPDLDSQSIVAESNSRSDEGSSDSQPCPKKRRLNQNSEDELAPSQFKLDDNARDDFLEMLDEHAKDAAAAPAEADTTIAAEEKSDSEEGRAEAEPASSQFKLDDSDRDNLLNMLTDKEQDESGVVGESSGAKKEEGSEFKLGNEGRDELLNLLEEIEEEREQIGSDSEQSGDGDVDDPIEDSDHSTSNNTAKKAPKNKPGTSSNPSQFKLDEDERDELLNLLSQHIKEGRNADGSESGSDDSEKDKEKRTSEEVNRDELLALLNEYEEAVNTGKKIKSSGKACLTNKNSDNVEMDFDMDFMKSDEEGSESSILLDVVREEAVDQPETAKRKPGRPKDPNKEAWEAYQALLHDDDDSLDTSSSESLSDLDIDDLEMDFSDQERRKEEQAKHANLRKEFGIRKELFIDLVETDISGFDLKPFQAKQGKSRNEDSAFSDSLNMKTLCDLSNVLQKRKRTSPIDRRMRKKPRRRSSSSDSSASPPRRRKSLFDSDHSLSPLSDDDSTMGNQDSASDRDSPIHTLSDDDEQERLANALWENIKNSSDERSRGSSSDSGGSSEEEKKVKKKRKKLNLGASAEGKKSKKDEASDEESAKSGSSTNVSEDDGESGEKEKKERISVGADLDSSDEDDFVGVRKGRGAWRYDPLLKSNLSSDSDLDSEQNGTPKKRLRKRKGKKQAEDSTDSDVTFVNSDNERTPVKKKVFEVSDDSDFEIIEPQKTPQKPILVTDDEDTPNKKGKGRRNIRALVEDEDLAEATQKANNEEKERIKRLQERDKAKEIFTQSQSFASQQSEDESEPLILDVNDDVQIKIHPKITKKLKPHQRLGIQFMWDSCYESLKQLQKENFRGSGCILAHCMGLGKTLQALALIQALLSNPITKTKHVLVVCPLSTVSNWRNEYNLAYKGIKHSHVKFYTIENKKAASQRFNIISKWRRTGGVLVMGYECFGILINDRKLKKWESKEPALCQKEALLKALVDPGPDLIICDEGHLLRNKQSQRTLALNKVKTRKRIVLTGTPLQNNLLEYYYMVHFVKPNLLGTEKEYKTNFVNPINNGQFEDSTAEDIMFMKKRTHCLHKILNKTVQRVEDTELKQYLPKLVDQAVFIRLSDLQVKLYNMYLDTAESRPTVFTKAGNVSHKNFLADVQILRYICLHPDVITTAEKNKSNIKEQDVIDDNPEDEVEEKLFSRGGWYKDLLPSEMSKKLELGSKMLAAINIVEEAAAKGDKTLIFAQFHAEMDVLETFLVERLKYTKDRDYYRMDGTISPELRTHMCDKFNNKNNKNVKVFIMSTKVGGLGLNLTAANRVIIMNVNWNPSYDTQSVFRAFRFGQNKAVYVYRLIAIDTMEEKMYQRVITKLAIAHRVVDKHQITRHYSAADIQEFYSVRPTAIGDDRPVPNVPEDWVLANLIQKHQSVYRWHEHQALLANRPEEDLDEQQKNAAWEEYNKKPEPLDLGTLPLGMQPSAHHVVNPLAQPGPSGFQKNMAIRYPPPLMRPRLPRYAKNPFFKVQGQPRRAGTSVATTLSLNAPASSTGNRQTSISNNQELINTIDMINMMIEADTTAEQAVPQYAINSRVFNSGAISAVDELNSIINESLEEPDSYASQN